MAQQPRSLNGKVAAITGAARGIGRATATALVGAGARVAIGDLDAELARATAGELGGGAIGLGLDVTDRGSFERFLDEVERELGPLDVLVNNAGIMHLGRFVEEDDAATLRQIDVNLLGVILGTRLALPRLTGRGAGHVVNIASSAGKVGVPGGATYSATKHAVVGLTEAVRAESQGSGVEFSIVMPGVVNTELAAGLARGRAIEVVEPEDVAAAIVAALRFPTVDVFVPSSIGPINQVMSLLPRRLREAVGRALKVDQILASFDAGSRASYESRAATSDPHRVAAGETARV